MLKNLNNNQKLIISHVADIDGAGSIILALEYFKGRFKRTPLNVISQVNKEFYQLDMSPNFIYFYYFLNFLSPKMSPKYMLYTHIISSSYKHIVTQKEHYCSLSLFIVSTIFSSLLLNICE